MLRGVSWTDFGAGVFLFLIFFQLLTLILYGRITIEEANLPLLIVETVARASGFRCYSSDLVKDLIGSVTREGFDFQIDTLMNAVRKGYQVRKHPISFRDREAGESKLGLGEYLNFLILEFSRLRF